MKKQSTEQVLIKLIKDGLRFGVIKPRCNVDHIYNKLEEVVKENE
jgi:hypothetical protein